MKIAFSTSGKTEDAPMDPRFGRAKMFLLHDTDTGNWEPVDNQTNVNALQGAGIKSAETVANCGAEAVVTGNCGPKAFQALSRANVNVYLTNAATVAEALEQFNQGKLQSVAAPNVQGHWI